MTRDDRPVLIYTTFPSLEEAKRVGDALVGARLAACVNMFPGMVSIYEWKGRANRRRGRDDHQDARLPDRGGPRGDEALHPYELPALLVLPTEGGSAEYCG